MSWLIFSQSRQANFLAHRLDHLPLARDRLQRLGDVLSHLDDLGLSLSRSSRWGFDDQALPRQVLGKRLAGRPTAFEGGDIGDLLPRVQPAISSSVASGLASSSSCNSIRSISRAPFRTLAILLAAHFGDLELEVPDHCLEVVTTARTCARSAWRRRHARPMPQARRAGLAISEAASSIAESYHAAVESPTKTE